LGFLRRRCSAFLLCPLGYTHSLNPTYGIAGFSKLLSVNQRQPWEMKGERLFDGQKFDGQKLEKTPLA
jgi:hypothetical protein